MSLLDSLKDLLTSKSSVQMVADNPEMASEILLLVRMMFADGQMTALELELFKNICESVFNIPEDDVPNVIQFLQDYGYETSGEQAAATFSHMPDERKQTLLVHLLSMARADRRLHEKEADLIARVAAVLGYSPQQIRSWL